jgi:EAL domain-containing protein (putative c-di-GMP-specific phosphodiesterase class I)
MSANACGTCHRCESVPDNIAGRGDIYAWFPLQHTFGKLYAHLVKQGFAVTSLADELCLRIPVPESMDDLLTAFDDCLLSEERKAVRVLHKLDDAPIGLQHLGAVVPLDQFAGLASSDWLLDLLRERRLTSHFQPIVHAGDTSQVYGYESLARGIDVDGGTVSPGRIFGAARTSDLLFQVDLACRRSAIRNAAEQQITERVFINFLPSAIYDPVFCLRSTVVAVNAAGLSREQVVFEVVESERAADTAHLKKILDFYRAEGFQVALDDVGAGYSSLNMIHELKPDFIKLDMALVQGVDQDPFKATIVAKLFEIAQELGIRTVAEGIETPGELAWVTEHGADFVQGFLVARPTAVPARDIANLSGAAPTRHLRVA